MSGARREKEASYEGGTDVRRGAKGAKGEGRAFEENNLREQAVWIPSSHRRV